MANPPLPTTPNMGLQQPIPLVTSGPDAAQAIVANNSIIDTHNHSPNQGVPVTPEGLNINADVSMQANSVRYARSMQLQPLSASLTQAPDASSVYVVGTDLWYTNTQGVPIQLTLGGAPIGGIIVVSGSGQAGVGPIYATVSSYPRSVTVSDQNAVLGIDTSVARTINLPSAATVMSFWIKDRVGLANTNNISVVPNGADDIEGINTTKLLTTNFGTWGLVSDGNNNWYMI